MKTNTQSKKTDPGAVESRSENRVVLPIYWNVWKQWTNGVKGVIIHAQADNDTKTLCGIVPDEGGGMKIPDETEPGCKKCRKILVKKGVVLSL